MPALDPTPFIWFDGKLVPWNEAQVHVLSHALHYGTGYFEGIRAYGSDNGSSSVFRLKEHMERMHRSAKILNLPCPYSVDELCKATLETLVANKMQSAYIRPLSFVGYGALGVHPSNNPVNTIIAVWAWGAYLGAEALDLGVRVKTSSFNRMHPNTHMGKAKACGNYVNSVLAKMEAVQDGYDEGVMLDTNGYISEATGENIFIVRRDASGKPYIKTTPLTSILEGINREAVIILAKDLGYEVVEAQFTRDEAYCAEEIFFTGTAAEVTPVREYDNRVIGIGRAGEVTKDLQKAFFDVVSGKNKKYAHWLTPYSF